MAVPTNQTMKDAIQAGVQAGNWRQSVDDLIAALTAEGLCYSSGEIAAYLRAEAPSLRFRVTRIGEHIRDTYWAGTLPEYDDGAGGTEAPVQMQYTTSGSSRTGSGQVVFVYGPDQAACDAHDFEVDIPLPPGVAPRAQVQPTANAPASTSAYPTSFSAPSQPAQRQPVNAPITAPAVAPKPVPASGMALTPAAHQNLTAKVHTDHRLCVPRQAFEAYLFASGRAMRAGDQVYVTADDDQAFITLDADPSATVYTLQSQRGRLLFAHPNTPFKPGTVYDVLVSNEGLTVQF